MRIKITKAEIAKLKPGGPHLADREIRGLVARRLPSGIVTFGLRYKIDGKQRWRSLGILGTEISVEEARAAAKRIAGAVAGGGDPVGEIEAAKASKVAAEESLVGNLAEVFLSHYAKEVRHWSLYNAQRIFARFIMPTFGEMPIGEIKRSDIVRLLDRINGDAMSNAVLAILSRFFNWHALRSDDFVSPIPRGLERGKRTSRERVLTDQEIADLWAVLGTKVPGVSRRFADHLKLILLTGQRPGEVGAMEAHEIVRKDGAPLWLIPASKYKTGKVHAVPLSPQAFALIERTIGDGRRRAGPFLFSRMGDIPLPNDSISVRSLRRAINDCRKRDHHKSMQNWTRHDLRRTSRTLLARIGVADEIAERVVGHVVGSRVGRTYNRFEYLDERRAALQRLADLVDEITNEPAGAEIVPLRRSA
jgi:integrase